MLRKLLFTLTIALLSTASIFAQSGPGSIKGTITEGGNKEPVPFANVTLFKGSNQIMGTTTDFDGKFTLKPIPPGVYDVQVSYVGFQTKRIAGVVVNSDKITRQNIAITQGVELKTVEIIDFKKPLIELDKTTSETTITREEIQKMAVRSVNDISKTAGNGVFSRDNGSGALNIRGQRSGSNVTFIDGVKVIGSTNLPKSAIEEVSVKTGGLSAKYGDATGGVRTITTRGGIKEYFGGIDFLSSGFRNGSNVVGLDNFGFNLLEFSVGGPIITRKDEDGKVLEAPVGFLLTGQLRTRLNPRPAATTLRKPNDNVERQIRENPYVFDPITQTPLKRTELLTNEDFEEIDFYLNGDARNAALNGKVDIKINDLSNVAIGGTFNYSNSNNYSRGNSLYNYENNSETEFLDFRVWGRYTQRFKNAELEEGEEDNSVIKNAFFTVQADFSRNFTETQDRIHKDNFFDYGYVGKFEANTRLSYDNNNFQPITLADGNEYKGRFLSAFDAPISIEYTPGDRNPILANYTRDFYTYFPKGDSRYLTLENVSGFGGVINGRGVSGAVYSMWTAPGTYSNGYSKGENDQIRVTGSGSADIGDHAILLGFEYEQRIQRSYGLSPGGLWNLGRQTVNEHISQIDSSEFTVTNGFPDPIEPTITFERRYGGDEQRTYFAYNVRKALGLPVDGTDFIDFDAQSPDLYKLEFFAADQLINPTNGIGLGYRGYDYLGNRLNSSPSLDDFFNETNELGFKTRPVPAYQPIYMAGYIEDKFAFDDLVFRVGLRLDRFDANQPVLKDQYSLFPTRNVAYAKLQGLANVPENIGDDYIVYVAELANPSVENVIGYRDPETNRFFNASGSELDNPDVLRAGGTIAPWLENPEETTPAEDLTTESFEDYEPQYTLMPRISFSFPISDEATFFANYDILTQRPSGNNAINPIDLIYIANHNRILSNPNLRPTKTISYELGFKQKVSANSALTLRSFYREQRDEIQVIRLNGAFPEDYLTYGNLDFGTVKGFTIDYDMRRIKNIAVRVNYTIQFAEGTGSGSLTSLNLVNSNQPNLRTIFPYSYDQRHQIVTTLDYRYGSGSRYNGPKLNGKNILENMGLNVVFRAGSGTPYTARSLPANSEGGGGSSTVQPVVGDVNGSRLPWTLYVDAVLDKTFDIKWGGDSEENEKLWNSGKKRSTLRVYLQVLNLLDRMNVQSVYAYTGNPDDDGYLAAPQFQDQIRTQINEQSFRDQYAFRLDNQFNFELPRRIRLGIELGF